MPSVTMTTGRAGLKKLQRIAIHAQGMGRQEEFGRGIKATEKAIQRIGYVQIDTISVVERAHHHVLYSRVPNYHPDHLAKLLHNRKIFEYWSHAAAFLPINDFRFSLPFKKRFRAGEMTRSRNKKMMKQVLDRITSEGPLMARDFEENRKIKSTGWWDWKPAKQALEQLFMQGDLMVESRIGFQKRYDLTENVLPDHINTTAPTISEFAEHLIVTSLRANGFANLKFFTHLRRSKALREEVKKQLTDLCEAKKMVELLLPDGDRVFIHPETWESRAPTISSTVKILSPFDNLVIQRDRLRSVFGFDYQIECYVPAAKRQYGYFCLPVLLKDQFIGRVDIKAHRNHSKLEIVSLHLDQPLTNTRKQAFNQAVESFASFNRCQQICWPG